MKYRREIDGLRAVAVLPVILFHAGFNAFSGGFIGVDVFFVISGYLITTIILADKEKGTFSLVTFYERRARRILPALFFVMLCCVPFSIVWLMPNHLIDFSKSLVAVSVFSSNILFWQESGYFATASELKPLLHTWSLAVEEQYYVLFPLFIMLMWKLRKRWICGSLIVIAIVSLAIAQWGIYNEPTATFYLLPTRAWELAIGALIAFYFLYKKEHAVFVASNRVASEALGLLGIALISYSIFAFNKSTPFPSLYALIPTIGTGLIIVFTTPQTFVGRFLGTKLMVGIGLISYSTYLWHQPLFVFARHRSLTEPNVTLLLSLSALSLVLAYLSWRYVEMPFRNKETFTRKKIFSFTAIGSITFALLGLMGGYSDGLVFRFSSNAYAATATAQQFIPLEKERVYKKPHVMYEKRIYLYGDSFARQLSTQLAKRAFNKDLGFVRSIFEGCPPVRGAYMAKHGLECYEFTEAVYDQLKNDSLAEYVIVAANWASYLNATKPNKKGQGIVLYEDSKNIDNYDELLNIYVNSINELIDTGKKIVIVYPIPSAKFNVPEHLLKASYYNDLELDSLPPAYASTSYEEFKISNLDVYEAFSKLKNGNNVIRVFPENVFCNKDVSDRCVVQENSKIFYYDEHHLSIHGVNLLLDEIFKQIDRDVLM